MKIPNTGSFGQARRLQSGLMRGWDAGCLGAGFLVQGVDSG